MFLKRWVELFRPKNAPALLAAFFLLSVLIRLPNLNRPLSEHHEWLTATSLRHIQIFHEDDPAKIHYSPGLSYKNKADKNINYGLGLLDANGNYYYLSFPPFAFILPYSFFKLFQIEPTILGLQLYNIFFHGICCLFLYLILVLLFRDRVPDRSRTPALIGALFYLFSPGPLWFQSNVYMSDMAIQPFLIIGVYLFLKVLKEGKKGAWLALFPLITLLGIYTEWLGVFFAFAVFCYAVFHFKKKGMVPLAVVTAISTLAALALIVWQYSQIAGLPALLEYARSKFLYRTGIPGQAQGGMSFTNILSWVNILVNYIGEFLPLIALIVFIVVRKGKRPPAADKDPAVFAVLFVSLLPALIHHLVFFNFTSIHDFSALKGGVFLSLLAGVLYHHASTGPGPAPGLRGANRMVVLMLLLSIAQYYAINAVGVHSRYKTIGESIRSVAKDDEVVFLQGNNLSLVDPQYAIYAHRNLAYWEGTNRALELMKKNGVTKGIILTINSNYTGFEKVERISAHK